MSTPKPRTIERPLQVFALTWFGQLISIIGSGLTGFAIGVRIYQNSGSITQFSLFNFVYFVPIMLLSPIAGALVDRWDRRRAMLLSDLGAGFSTFMIWVLLELSEKSAWKVENWHFYIPVAMGAACSALRWPAYYASTSLLVPKQHLGRANGMIELANGAGQITTPVLAGALMLRIGLRGIILIDLATFAVAVGTLLLVRFPRPAASAPAAAKRSLASEIAQGWSFIRARPGLRRLLLFVASSNLITSMVVVLITPLILSFTDMKMLGVLLSISGMGMLVGALLMSVWGGPKRRIRGVVGFNAMAGVALLMAALPPTVVLFAGASALFLCAIPMYASCSQAIWQVKVPPELQGRVFAVRRMITLVAPPVGTLLCGPLADHLFEPLMAKGGPLADTVGRVLGVGTGRGIALLFIVLGGLMIVNSLLAFLAPRVRNLEDELPDMLPSRAPSNAVPAPAAQAAPGATESARLTPQPGAPQV